LSPQQRDGVIECCVIFAVAKVVTMRMGLRRAARATRRNRALIAAKKRRRRRRRKGGMNTRRNQTIMSSQSAAMRAKADQRPHHPPHGHRQREP
jgi:hypothetical protein